MSIYLVIIKEIIKSEDDSETKVLMIDEILKKVKVLIDFFINQQYPVLIDTAQFRYFMPISCQFWRVTLNLN